MQTRKDLYQAHRLMTQRVALALLQGRPSAAESPLRRTGVGTLCGVMVAVLVAAGFGVTGLIFKGGARNIERPGVLIIEKETGATYAYSRRDHKLIPFLNYASARLAMSTTDIQRKSVSSKSLEKYPRGPMTGIQGAPESLPPTSGSSHASWSLCTRTASPAGSTVSVAGGRDIGGRPLNDAQGVVVRGGSQDWLIWHNSRMRITTKAARGLSAEEPVPVDERWLNGLPQGPDYAAPAIPQQGHDFPGPGNTAAPAGQIFRVAAIAGTPERWYVQLPDGLASISATQARLLLDSLAAGPPRDITPAEAASKPSKTNLYDHALPETPPHIVPYDPRRPLCTVYPNVSKLSTDARFTIGGSLPDPSGKTSSGLDQVILPGGGTFAGTLSGPGQPLQTFCLLTDQGLRYPVPTSGDIAKLGYSAKDAIPIPANLLQLFKQGPTLTSSAALRPVPAN